MLFLICMACVFIGYATWSNLQAQNWLGFIVGTVVLMLLVANALVYYAGD